MGLTVAQLFARMGLTGADQTVRGLQRVDNQVNRTQRGLGGLGRAGSRLGTGLARVATVAGGAVAAGLVGSAKAAIDYETAFAGVRKTVDATEPQLKQLSSDFREMSTEIPISAVRLAGLGETAGALGIGAGSSNPIGQIKEFVRVVALIGETTDVSADIAATSLGQLGNVLDLRQQDYERFGSTLVDLGNKGASTESQILAIATRSGAASKQIGMAKAATLGWSSAVANLGIEEEAAGSALQKFFLESLKGVSAGGKELKIYAKTAGMTAREFKRAYEKDASGALEKFINGLGKLSKAQQLATLEALGFTDIRITRTLLGLAGSQDNLTNSLDVAGTAWAENTALAAEAQKRFDTVASAIQVLKNNIVDAAIEVGTGMLPGIKRFTQETVGFIKANRDEIKELGTDIGRTLDGVHWRELLDGGREFIGVLKDAGTVAVGILETLNKLPTEVKAAGLALIALDKLAPGVVPGVAGDVIKGAAGRLPGVGSLVATPVRVVNWPAGGIGGAGGAAPSVGTLKPLLAVIGPAVAAAVASDFVTNQTNQELGTNFVAPGTGGVGPVAIVAAIHNLGEIFKLTQPKPTPLNITVPNPDRDYDRAAFRPKPAPPVAFLKPDRVDAHKNAAKIAAAVDKTTTKVEGMRGSMANDLRGLKGQSATDAKIIAASQARTAGAARQGLGRVVERVSTSIGVERSILAKKRDVLVTVKPASTTLNVDGRRFASAMTRYDSTARAL